MKQIYLWILISLGIGAMAGLLTAIFSHHKHKKVTHNADGSTHETTEDEDDLDEIEGSRSANIIFVILVFAVLAFIVIWLLIALSGREIEL